MCMLYISISGIISTPNRNRIHLFGRTKFIYKTEMSSDRCCIRPRRTDVAGMILAHPPFPMYINPNKSNAKY